MMVSIIIVSWKSRDVIGRCLSSLRRSHPVDREIAYKPLEIILVDNASHDGTLEYVGKNFPEVILIKNSENRGFSYANNQGIRRAKGEFILFLNADAYITPDFLDVLIGEMEKDQEIGCAGGKIYKDRKGKILDSTGIFSPLFKIGPYDRGEGEEDRGQYDKAQFVSGITCACALYRRKCLDDIRLGNEYFDEDYFAYYEDVDLSWRARIQGWRCLYEPKAIAYHRRRGKAIKDTPLFSRAMANLYLTYLKNESGIGLVFLCLFKIPNEIGRVLFRIVFRGKASYSPRVLESLRLGKGNFRDAISKRRVIHKKRIRIWIFSLMQQVRAVPQLRIAIPFSFFPRNEFEFVYTPSLKAIPKLLNIPQVIVFHRDAYPFREVNRIIKFARSCGIVTILDMDDCLTNLPVLHPIYSHYQKIKSSLIELLKTVDIVTVTNDRLKEYCQRYNPEVHVLPNFLDERIWTGNGLKKKKDNKIVIGYAGSPTHVYDFKVVVPAIKYILSKYNGRVSFKFIGCIPRDLQVMSGVEYISQRVSYEEYANTLMDSNFDFVLTPLEDNIFNHCKSNIKFLEYSICGYAAIYSAVGPYIDSVVHNDTGILIKNETSEWIQAMELLINTPELRQDLSRNAFQHVKINYCNKGKSKEWCEFYSKIPASLQEKKILKRSLSYVHFFVYMQWLNIYYTIRKQLILFSLPVIEKRKWTPAGKDILREELKKQAFPSHSRVLLLRGPEPWMVNDVCDVLKGICPQAEIVMLVGDERRIEKFKGGILDLPYRSKIGYFFKLWSRIFKKFDLILILRKDAFLKKVLALASFSRASFTISDAGRLEKVGILSIFRKR